MRSGSRRLGGLKISNLRFFVFNAIGGSKFVDGVLTNGLESEIAQIKCGNKLHPTASLAWL